MSKNVRFGSSPPKGSGSRSSRHERDSGVGSSSSEQASTGGKPDRKFTAQDREEQRQSPTALREALDSAMADNKRLKKKCIELDLELSNAHKTTREKEAARRAQFDENFTLKEHIDALKHQIAAQKDDLNDIRDENEDLKQRLLTLMQPVDSNSPMMSGGSGTSGGSVRRSKSKRDSSSKDQTDRMRERINKVPQEGESSSSSKSNRNSRGRRPSVSVSNPNRAPYIEEPPPSPVSSRASYHPHYTTSAPTSTPTIARMDQHTVSSIPRTTQAPVAYAHRAPVLYQEENGNYVPYPLPEDRSKSRKH